MPHAASVRHEAEEKNVDRQLVACAILMALLAPLAADGGVEQLVINEVMTSPLPGTSAESGFWDTFNGVTRFVTSDWVEIYNPGPGAVPLEGLYLTDNCNYIQSYRIGAEAAAILAPSGLLPEGGFALIWCPGYFRGDYNCTTEPDGQCDYPIPVEMAPIRLSSTGEWIGLYTSAGALIDGFQMPALPSGRTYGCVPDGNKSVRTYLQASTSKRANAAAAVIPPSINVRSYRAVKVAGDPPVETLSFLVDAGDEVRIRVNVTDLDDPDPSDSDNNIAEARLYWKLTAPGSFENVLTMTQVMTFDPAENDPSLYEARIPGQAGGKVVAFHAYARDNQGNESRVYWSDAYNPDASPKIWFQYPVGSVGFSGVTIHINEVLADNQNVRVGGGGDPATTAEIGGYDCGVEGCIDGRRQADEWVELYNFGPAGVDLATCDLYMTNNELFPTRFRLADAVGHHPNVAGGVLGAGTPMLVWCDGEPWQNDTVGVHADFTLSANEDQVLLFAYKDADANGDPEVFIMMDLVSWGGAKAAGGDLWLGAQDGDWSLGRFPTGAPEAKWGRMDPTPGASPHPGAANTGLVPAVKVLGHEPVIATSSDVVKVTARVWDDGKLPLLPAADPSATGWYGVKIDFGDFAGFNATKVMRDDGLEGDVVAGDGIYTAELTDASGNKPVGKVRYAVTAVDQDGNRVRIPRHGAQYVLFFVGDKPAGTPVITEVVASNRNCQCDAALPPGCDRAGLDNRGDAEDWVEIYNPTASPIYLGDYSLSDRLDWLTRWVFPAVTLGAGQRIIVWCDNELDETDVNSIHAGFGLDAGGDEVYLVAKASTDRQIVDFVRFGSQRSDVASGRPEGGADFGVLVLATPGEPNSPLAANIASIAEAQPVPAGTTITVKGLALDRAVKIFIVDPLVMRGSEVVRWDWDNAADTAFTLSGDDLRIPLPAGLAAGVPHRLCVLSEYDPDLEYGGLWRDAGLAWTDLIFTSTEGGVEEPEFKRGDANADGKLDIADAIKVLSYLFGGGTTTLDCLDAGDANDDGKLDIADAVKILGHLFAQTGPLPAPFDACGPDPTDGDTLDCTKYAPCGTGV
ncbi:MAG TPA: hypothetical protein DCM87_09740 [Planctomycetes bacterium]|nr:hypothetical protein [Planctomycetota bacterium]